MHICDFYFSHSDITARIIDVRSHGEPDWHWDCSHHASCYDIHTLIIPEERSRSKCFICLFNMKRAQSVSPRTKSDTRSNQTSDKSCNFPLVGLPPLTPHLPSLTSSAHLRQSPAISTYSAQLSSALPHSSFATWEVPDDSPVVILHRLWLPCVVCPLVNHSLSLWTTTPMRSRWSLSDCMFALTRQSWAFCLSWSLRAYEDRQSHCGLARLFANPWGGFHVQLEFMVHFWIESGHWLEPECSICRLPFPASWKPTQKPVMWWLSLPRPHLDGTFFVQNETKLEKMDIYLSIYLSIFSDSDVGFLFVMFLQLTLVIPAGKAIKCRFLTLIHWPPFWNGGRRVQSGWWFVWQYVS